MTNNLKKSSLVLVSVYMCSLFLGLHFALSLYINSSFLELNFSSIGLSLLYILGSVANIVLLINAPKLFKRFSNYGLLITFLITELLAVAGLALVKYAPLIAILFIIRQAIVTIIYLNIDILLEGATKKENFTGRVRSYYLTLYNIAVLISPAIVAFVLTDGDYWKIYLLSELFLLPVILIAYRNFRIARDTHTPPLRIVSAIKAFLAEKNERNIFVSSFLLQFFYACMIIYMPIHLHQYIGFEWSKIGLIFTIMLLPFILFEIPVGRLVDKKFGEKEILMLGFFITAIATITIPFIAIPSFALWAGILFLTRVGASFVEITTESYFFKHVNSANRDTISLFRITQPLAFIVAPIIVTITLFFIHQFNLQFGYIFFVVGIIMLSGLKFSFCIKDTK